MNKTLRQILLFTFIPLAGALILYNAGYEKLIDSGDIFKFLLGGYIIAGLILLFTSYHHTGKVLLISGGIITCLGLLAYLIFVVVLHAGYGVH